MRSALPILGAFVGMALAVFGVLDDPPAVGGDVVAVVDGRPIDRETLERAVSAVAEDLDVAPDVAMRRRVLERMIDEELLVARALELGVAQRDPLIRTSLGRSVIDLLASSVPEPEADEIDDYYRAHPELFVETPRAEIRVARFVGEHRRARADAVARRPWAEVVERADEVVFAPDVTTSLVKLADYVGTEVAQAASAGLGRHRVDDGGRSYVVEVVRFEPGRLPPLADIEGLVATRLRRDLGDRALRLYLDEARRSAAIRVAPELQ